MFGAEQQVPHGGRSDEGAELDKRANKMSLRKKLIAAGLLTCRTAVVAERAKFRCEYCKLDLLASAAAYRQWEFDHIVPRTCDGTDDVDNMACACMICNRVKNRFDPREVLGSKYTRADAIRVATDYIQAQHEATTRHYVSKYRSIIQEG
jgi:HNH endonuclease